MPNIRIVSDNAIERAILSASSSAGAAFSPANLAGDLKANIWRGLSKAERLDALWATPESIQAVGAPNCNWSPTATWRIRTSNEAAMTNLLRYSAAFDNALWVNTGTTYVANATTAPDGTLTAERLVETATTADHMMTAPAVTVTAGVTYTWSIFVKADTRKRLRVAFPAAQFAANERATFDVTLNTIPSINGGSPTIASIGGGWDRITLTGACTTGGSAVMTVYMMPDTGTSTTSYAGATANSIYVWGAQLETGAVATSYYPTGAAAATRPAGYIDTWQSYDYDSGWVQACPAPAAKLRRFTAAQAASAYAFGGGTFARHWMPMAVTARRLAIDIDDSAGNQQGFVEATNLVAAPYWEAEKNADYGADATPVDSTQVTRSGGGDLMAAQSTRSKKLKFSLSKMSPADRAYIWDVLRASGVGYPVWISLFPENPDLHLEATHQIWGCLEQLPSMALPSFRVASATLSVQSS
jgi:hypothetical protein